MGFIKLSDEVRRLINAMETVLSHTMNFYNDILVIIFLGGIYIITINCPQGIQNKQVYNETLVLFIVFMSTENVSFISDNYT